MSTKNDEANTTDTCENCSTSFNLFKRKKICAVCNQAFCQYCVSRLPQSARSSSRICNTCKTICAPQSTIDDLLNIKVKHLRSVLSTSNIPTSTCKEKRDLVDLFFRNREKFDQFSSRPVANNYNNNNNNINNNNNNINYSNNMHSSANGNQQQSSPFNDTFNSFINNVQGFVSSNLGSVLNGGAVPCPPPPNRTEQNRSNHNTSSSSASSTSSQNFNTMFNIFGEQLPNVFSHFNVNQETNTQPSPPTQSQTTSTEPRSQPQSQSQPMNSEPSQSQTSTKRRASLADLKCPQDIDQLSIKQIKEILANNFVEYKGCCERSELVDKLKRLFISDRENKRREQQLNNPSTNNDSRLNSEETDVCKICMESIMDCVLLDCGHMCSCIKCGKQLAECPICRQNVVRVVRVFKS